MDAKAPSWAIRHYDVKTAPLDRSSPLGVANPDIVLDPKAVGMAVSMRDRDAKVKVFYLTGSGEGPAIARKTWSKLSLLPEVRQVEGGDIEISITLGDREIEKTFMFMLLWTLGHGIYP